MPPKRAGGKTKTPSTYTYTGCWTCRRRHIKCDEEKPACRRCTRAGFECQGYDFRFAGSDSSRSFRRPVALGSSAQRLQALSNAEVNSFLDELDTATSSKQKGPFSVLAFAGDASSTSVSTPSSSHTNDVVIRPGRVGSVGTPPSPQDSGYVSPGQSEEEAKSGALARRSQTTSPVMVQEPHFLSVPVMQSELFEHWTSFLCNNMSPLSGSAANPFRYTYPALALEGLMLTPDSSTAAARLAVFHGLCGTAAWSLARMKPENPAYRALSVNHDQLALGYIQQTIEQPGGIRDAAVPAAIMTCLTGDILSGRLDLWGKHLHGGFRCLMGVLSRQKTSDHTTSVVCQQYMMSASFANFGSPAEIRLLKNAITSQSLYIEECHCITRAMLEANIAINRLAASVKAHHPAEIERVRLQLVRSIPKFPEPVRHHISQVYYCAISIHFTRAIMHSTDTQQLASRAIDHLEMAKSTGRGRSGQILMWPLMKIASECTSFELRTRLMAWCASQLKYHVSNMDMFASMLQKTWSIATLEGTDKTVLTEVNADGEEVEAP